MCPIQKTLRGVSAGRSVILAAVIATIAGGLGSSDVRACCPWQIESVSAPDVVRCMEEQAIITLTAPASQDVLIEVTLHPPQDDPGNPHPSPPPPGRAEFVDPPPECAQGPSMVLACIPQGSDSVAVTYRGEEETDPGYPVIIQACIATDTCSSMACDGTCDPTNCGVGTFEVTPVSLEMNVDWYLGNPSNMISVNSDYDENNSNDARDNEGDPGIVDGDEELKRVKLDMTGTPGLRGTWEVSGAEADILLWESGALVPWNTPSEEVTLPAAVILTIEGIDASGGLDGTTLTATFTPEVDCDPPPPDAIDDMSFTVVLAEVNSSVEPDKYEEEAPGALLCANDDYDEEGPNPDNEDGDPLHHTTGALVLDDMVAPTLLVQPTSTDFLNAVDIRLTCGAGRIFGVDDGNPVQWQLLGGGQDVSDYFGTGAKSDWSIWMEGISGSDDMTLRVERVVGPNTYEVAVDKAKYTVSEMLVEPSSGEIGTVITITACGACAGEFDDETTVEFTGVFEPEGADPTPQFTVTYPAGKVHYDAASPDQVKIILGDALPGDANFWTNPGVLARARGTLRGTIEVGSCSTGVLFTVTPTVHEIAEALAPGAFVPTDSIRTLPINSSTDVFNMMNPPYGPCSYDARILVANNGPGPAGASPAPELSATLRMRRADGTLVSSGLTATFELYASSASEYEYRISRFILFNQSVLEGIYPEAYVLRAPLGSKLEIIVQP